MYYFLHKSISNIFFLNVSTCTGQFCNRYSALTIYSFPSIFLCYIWVTVHIFGHILFFFGILNFIFQILKHTLSLNLAMKYTQTQRPCWTYNLSDGVVSPFQVVIPSTTSTTHLKQYFFSFLSF